jgi:DNA-binding CsgD family transcriptional regulator
MGRRVLNIDELVRWMATVGTAAQAIGTAAFHERLLDLLGDLIPHDYAMVVRYHRVLAPEIVLARGIAPLILKGYFAENAYRDDPFLALWRSGGEARILTLNDLPPEKTERYRSVFVARADIADEVVIFLPGIGQSVLALSLERRKGRFAPGEIDILRAIYPVLEGLYLAQARQAFVQLGSGGAARAAESSQPMLLLDKAGKRVFANAAWRKAARGNPALNAATSDPDGVKDIGGYRLVVETSPEGSIIAPGGRALYLVKVTQTGSVPPSEQRKTAALLAALTPREQAVLHMLIEGRSTGEIARALSISKGTVKNHLLRMYRKTNVSSQKALMLRFIHLRNGV